MELGKRRMRLSVSLSLFGLHSSVWHRVGFMWHSHNYLTRIVLMIPIDFLFFFSLDSFPLVIYCFYVRTGGE